MKKAQIFVRKSILLALLVFIYSCVEDDKKSEQPPCDCPVADENYDNGIIFPDKAQKLYGNYEDRRVNLIQDYEDAIDEEKDGKGVQRQDGENQTDENTDEANRGKFKVARYVSYNYEDLKKYLAYIENEAKLSGEKLSTLRFYFANYANEQKFEDGKPVVHPRQNSIMMSPTIKRDNQEHIFYTTDGKDGKREIVILDNDFRRRKGVGTTEEQSKSEASLLPSFLSSSNAPPMFADRSTTKNEGSSHP